MPNLVLAESELLPVLQEAFEGWGWKGKVKEIPSCHLPLHNYCAVIVERFKIIIIVVGISKKLFSIHHQSQ